MFLSGWSRFFPLFKSLGTVLIRPPTIVITTLMFSSIFTSLTKFKYLSIFSVSFIFTQSPAGTAKSTWWQICHLLPGMMWSVFLTKFQRILMRLILCDGYIICLYGQILVSCTIPRESPFQVSRACRIVFCVTWLHSHNCYMINPVISFYA